MPRQAELATTMLTIRMAVLLLAIVLVIVQALLLSPPDPATFDDRLEFLRAQDRVTELRGELILDAMIVLVYLTILAVVLAKLREGSKAARIVLTVASVFFEGVLGARVDWQPSSIVELSNALVRGGSLVLAVAVLVLVWQKPVGAWLAATTAYNRQFRRREP
jgi:hypothetical protein